jgi:parvulin-like peptidyl-prolyl isomerase
VLSGYGTHLVYVSHRTETQPQAFTDVEAMVLQNWQDERRKELNEQFVANLLDRYEVVIEEVPADAATTTAGAGQ